MSIGGEFVPGGSSAQLMGALDLLADPKKFQTKLAQLKAAEDAAASAVKDANLVADIQKAQSNVEQALADAHRARNEAQVALNAADVEAKRIVNAAEKEALDTKAAAQNYRRATAEQSDELLKNAAKKAALMDALEQRLKGEEDKLALGFSALAQREAEVAEMKLVLKTDKNLMDQAQKDLEKVFAALKS